MMGGQLQYGRTDHSIELLWRQGHPFVRDLPDVQSSVQQIGQEILAGDRVIGGEMRGGYLAMRIDVVGDFVFGEHVERRVGGRETGWLRDPTWFVGSHPLRS